MANRPSADESKVERYVSAPITQRAYTLRLRPAITKDDSPDEIARKRREMQDALWATHEVVNRGTKVFGDWLLTLRGGLDHKLADAKIAPVRNDRERAPTPEERRNRRILLALSWLSVEDERGAPPGDSRVASGRDCLSEREKNLVSALRAILKARGVANDEVESWIVDCQPSLSAAIREDAVWVNRRSVFDQHREPLKGIDYKYATQTIFAFFGPREDYFALLTGQEDDDSPTGGSEGPEFRTLARQWVSTHFGTGDKSDISQISEALKKLAAADLSGFRGRSKPDLLGHLADLLGHDVGDSPEKALRLAVGWKTGRPSKGRLAVEKLPNLPTKDAIEMLQAKFAEEAVDKEAKLSSRGAPSWIGRLQADVEQAIGMRFVIDRNLIGEYSVMLDHAARRVSIAHSWIKRAEAERQRFIEDANKINQVPPKARDWLQRFCATRSRFTGAVGEYRIRPRAIEGWDAIVRRWSREECKTEQDRITAAREVQADPEINKFGDIQLFEALAVDDADCIWRSNGKADSAALKVYVGAMHACDRRRRFKVPAYRHPDPLLHPVFCDFGNSRWSIRFAVHEREKARRNNKRVSGDDAEWHKDGRGVRMGLWTGQRVGPVPMCWACKRLVGDLALDALGGNGAPTPVTRADRLGRAASGVKGAVAVLNVFDEKDWNGRLQAPRAQLDRLASLFEKKKMRQAESLRRHLRWLVSFSPRLRPVGPFIEFASHYGITPNRKGEYYPHGQQNKTEKRQGHAKLVLSRLPGLRVLSVDLGHRFAAACTVWEALSPEDFETEIRGCEIVAGGATGSDLFCHTRHTDDRGKSRTTVYRRIGADELPDGKPHPAPWARLDRQFLIKLPGEEKPARAASPTELDAVRRLEADFYRTRTERDSLPRRVDELMAEAVGTLRLALARHARRAKIARALDANTRSILGMGGSETPFRLGDETHVKLLTDALFDWHSLASQSKWDDPSARELWNTYIHNKFDGAWKIDPPMRKADGTDDRTRQQRRKDDDTLRDELNPIAQQLANTDRAAISTMWRDRWQTDDGTPAQRDAGSDATGIHAHLRILTDWIMGRRCPGANSPSNGWKQNVGGLSLTRIANMRSLYQLHKAFAMRAKPDKPRGAPEKGESNAGVAQSILDAMERMREQRVKQLVSRIIEAALGVGRMKPVTGRDRKRPQSRVDVPCHAVVIESLRNYRPDELRTRRENRALMTWSAGRVRKYLEEGCQLHGLHLREVMPNYTSRQDSRTGLAGVRCDDVSIDEFLTAPFWHGVVSSAKKKVRSRSTDAEPQFLVDIEAHLTDLKSQGRPVPTSVLLPRRGGDLFVAAPPSGNVDGRRSRSLCNDKRALQADLNAAANIGLRALLDPDFPGKWWYVPCREADGMPHPDKVKGSACFGNDPASFGSLRKTHDAPDSAARTKRVGRRRAHTPSTKEVTNFWADPAAQSLRPSPEGFWLQTPAYWHWVKRRVICALRTRSGLDLECAAVFLDPDEDLR